jgi:hypothetical protein
VTVRSAAGWIAGISSTNPAATRLFCALCRYRPLRRAYHPSRGVLSRACCVSVFDTEIRAVGRLRPNVGCCAAERKGNRISSKTAAQVLWRVPFWAGVMLRILWFPCLYPSNSATIRAQFLSHSIVVQLVLCGENANYPQGEIFIFVFNGCTKSDWIRKLYACSGLLEVYRENNERRCTRKHV